MTIHEFDFQSFNTGQEVQQSFVPKPKDHVDHVRAKEEIIVTNPGNPGARVNDERNLEQCEPCQYSHEDLVDINFVEEVRETYPVGFKLMDRGIKNYFSGIRIPTGKGTEDYTILPVRISTGDSDALIYSDQHIVGGRLEIPYLAIVRESETYDPKRYTPPILPMTRHMINKGRKSELVYRPVPYIIQYSLEIKAEHKSEAEYALFAIISKINPIGSFFLEEKSMGITHEVIIHPGTSTDSSDLEVESGNRAYIKKSITMTMEGWLPTPTKVVPNILAKPFSIKEGIGKRLDEVKIPGETYSVIRDLGINQGDNNAL